jgi:hypothetical protein
LIWMIPVVGAILVIAVLTNTRKLHRPQPRGEGSGRPGRWGTDFDSPARGAQALR